MGELVHEEGWAPKNWCFWVVVLEKTLESPLDCKIKAGNPKVINLDYLLEGLMLKLKLQYFGHLMGKDSSLENTLMLEKTWRQKGKGMAKDEMYKMLKASPTQWTCIWANSKDRKGQRNLVCYNPWSHKVLDMTWRLNNNMDFIYLANSILGGVYDLLIIT